MQQGFRHGDRTFSVTVQRSGPARVEVGVDGAGRMDAVLLDADTVQLTADGVVHTVAVARVGDTYQVVIGGELYVLAPVAAGADVGASAAALASPQIVAPMPGKVLQVLVQAGQKVAAGDGLLILEAMKMEHRMTAEAAATVRAVHVADGQMVDAGVVLVELEYDGAAAAEA
jgi:acetyl/propionyl-CoA carboxylase alpha subunit